MANLYHYNGMRLHYLSEDFTYAVYYREPQLTDGPKNMCNPYRVYKLIHDEKGIHHHLLAKYADLKSAIACLDTVRWLCD